MYKPGSKEECLAYNIRLFCEANEMTYRDFVALVGISEATLHTWLSGKSMPDDKHQKSLENVFSAKFDKICSNIIATRLLLDATVTIEDVFPYNCIISSSFGSSAGVDALANYECSTSDDFDFSYREISPSDFDKVFHTLTYREQSVIELRYRDSLTLEDVGRKMGVTRERIRQIELKALRKIHIGIVKSIRDAKNDVESLKSENETLKKYIASLESANPSDNTMAPVLYPKLNTVIEDLDFSVRTYNCLKRARLNTVKDIIDYENGLTHIRNLGKKGVIEIADTVENLDVGYIYDYDADKFIEI